MPGTSVELITGRIGDGKTYHTLKYRLIPALQRGRHVYTNIDFGPDYVTKADGAVLSTGIDRFKDAVSMYLDKDCRHLIHQFKDETEIRRLLRLRDMDGKLLEVPKGSTIIIDEAQMIWPAPIPGNVVPIDPLFIKWVAYVRHFDQELILVTQSPNLVHKSLLGLMNENVHIKNLAFLSSFLGKQYKVTYRQSVWAEPHGSENHRFDPEIFRLYQSAMAYGVKNKRMLPSFMLLPLVGLCAWFLFMVTIGRKTPVLRSLFEHKAPITATKPPPATSPVQPVQPPVSRNIEAVLAAIQEAEANLDLKDAPAASLGDEDTGQQSIKTYNATERGRKLWADPEYRKKHNLQFGS